MANSSRSAVDPTGSARALVYLYQYWDESSQSHRTSTVYATLLAIHSGLGTPIYETARPVKVQDLQGGIYAPREPIVAAD